MGFLWPYSNKMKSCLTSYFKSYTPVWQYLNVSSNLTLEVQYITWFYSFASNIEVQIKMQVYTYLNIIIFMKSVMGYQTVILFTIACSVMYITQEEIYHSGKGCSVIGLLDIYGFEVLQHNRYALYSFPFSVTP